MRVPGIFYMPETVLPGTVTELGSTLDLLPTIANLTGAKVPDDRPMDGFNLMPVLTKKAKSARDHFIYYRMQDIYAVRKGDYKAHFITETCYTRDNQKTILEKPLLYHLNHDPSEQYDKADSEPAILKELVELADTYKNEVVAAESELDKVE